MFSLLRDRRRDTLRSEPLPEPWRAIVDANLGCAPLLSAADRAGLEGHVQVLLAEKSFEGCGGLELTDEIRVTSAAHAALLLLHREEPGYYPELESILVYPGAYLAKSVRQEGSVVIESEDTRLEKPRALRARHAALYAQLAAFYQQDPAGWGA